MSDKWCGSDSATEISEFLTNSVWCVSSPNFKSDEVISSEAAVRNLNAKIAAGHPTYDFISLFPDNNSVFNLFPYCNVPELDISLISTCSERQEDSVQRKSRAKREKLGIDKPPRCNNCGTSVTTLWRRAGGKLMCNPCALYFKLHGIPRPFHLIKNCITRRKRRTTGKNN
jgi:hypothetical protein